MRVDGPMRYPLVEGRSYLARDIEESFVAFSELTRNGHDGLCITRTSAEEIRRNYGLQTTPIRWLSEEEADGAIPPGDLLALSLAVKDFMQKGTRPVIILDGLEYLTRVNGFAPVLRLVDGLNDLNAKTHGILLLPLLPNTLDQREDNLLVAETTPFPMEEGARTGG